MSTRRRFLCLSSAVLASTAVPKAFAQRQGMPVFSNASLGSYTQGSLSRARFEGLVGSSFRVFLEDGQVATLTLLKVENSSATRDTKTAGGEGSHSAAYVSGTATGTLAAPVRPTAAQCFTVHFSTGGVVVPQDSYTVDHATLGSFSVFLVPGQDKNGGKTVTATFFYL